MSSSNRGIFHPEREIGQNTSDHHPGKFSTGYSDDSRWQKPGKTRHKILIVLSSKSSGSSAMQHYLTHNYDAHYIQHSDHFEHESLFWTKAASILSLPQDPMHQSEVPIPADKAVDGLEDLLKKNKIQTSVNDQTNKEEFFELFYRLCRSTGSPSVEKSPHHLFNFSNVQLILEFKEYIAPRADVALIGLVRNPIDTVYSAWTRWRFDCRAFEKEWYSTYNNLYSLVEQVEEVAVFRYEELSQSSAALDEFLIHTCGLTKKSEAFTFNGKSVQKWKKDGLFRYKLSPEVKDLALHLGYNDQDLDLAKDVSLWLTAREVLHGLWVRWKRMMK